MRVLRAKTRTLYDLLPQPVLDRVLATGTSRGFKDGQIIQQRGDDRQGISVLTSGQIVAGNAGADGSFLVSALLRPGETFGEFTVMADLPHTHTLWSQGETTITFIKGSLARRLMDEEPAFAHALLTIALLRNHELLEFLDAQRRLTLPIRIAQLLLTSVDSKARADRVECRQEDLAVTLGVSRVATGKALKRLEQDGMVELGYGRIDLPDVQGLIAKVEADDPLFMLPRA